MKSFINPVNGSTAMFHPKKGKLPRGYTAGPLLDSYFDYDSKLYAFGEDYQPHCIGEVIGNIYENGNLLEDGASNG